MADIPQKATNGTEYNPNTVNAQLAVLWNELKRMEEDRKERNTSVMNLLQEIHNDQRKAAEKVLKHDHDIEMLTCSLDDVAKRLEKKVDEYANSVSKDVSAFTLGMKRWRTNLIKTVSVAFSAICIVVGGIWTMFGHKIRDEFPGPVQVKEIVVSTMKEHRVLVESPSHKIVPLSYNKNDKDLSELEVQR